MAGLIINNANFSTTAIEKKRPLQAYYQFTALKDNYWYHTCADLYTNVSNGDPTGWMCADRIFPKASNKILIFDENGMPNTRPIRVRTFAKLGGGTGGGQVDNLIATSEATLSDSAKYIAINALYLPLSGYPGLEVFDFDKFQKYTFMADGADAVPVLANPLSYCDGYVATSGQLITVGTQVPSNNVGKFWMTFPTIKLSDVVGVKIKPKTGYRVKTGYAPSVTPASNNSKKYKVLVYSSWFTNEITLGSEIAGRTDPYPPYLMLSVSATDAHVIDPANILDFIEITY